MNLERWLLLMEAWGFSRNEETFEALVNSYSEKGRHYHTVKHIEACLAHLDRCLPRVEHPREVELALWFHDAIYEPLAGCNEKRSADWASEFLRANGAAQEDAARVYRLIVVTEHNAPTQTRDESILLDIDLTILGSSSEVYDAFENGIRKEYRHVPTFIYRKKRIEVLQGFLDRPNIYRNEVFSEKYEQRAKENLVKAISKLEGRA